MRVSAWSARFVGCQMAVGDWVKARMAILLHNPSPANHTVRVRVRNGDVNMVFEVSTSDWSKALVGTEEVTCVMRGVNDGHT